MITKLLGIKRVTLELTQHITYVKIEHHKEIYKKSHQLKQMLHYKSIVAGTLTGRPELKFVSSSSKQPPLQHYNIIFTTHILEHVVWIDKSSQMGAVFLPPKMADCVPGNAIGFR